MCRTNPLMIGALCVWAAMPAAAADVRWEVSKDGQETVMLAQPEGAGLVTVNGRGVLYGTTPDWQNSLRYQVGGLAAADVNNDGWTDVIVGCYSSSSYPPYPDWENMIYLNTGGQLEANPSWMSSDEVSTGDVQVGDINRDGYPDVFAANGGASMSPCVIYWGSPTGPSPTPGWTSQIPGLCWTNYATIFDFDHDNDLDVVIAGQGNSQNDPYRPMRAFFNNAGTLATAPGWTSAETSIQNFLAFADYDGDGWEDLAVSKWANFQSGIYKNVGGALQTTPIWTTGNTDTDKGVAWADVDGNGWPDLVLGHSPTRLYGNTGGSLSLVWSSAATYFGHSDLRFCDIDRDGDEDLAEVHFSNGQTHIYLNNGGTLDSAPTWTYDSTAVGTALAFGDINGDHWPDLIIGYSGQPCVVVFYAVPPAEGGKIVAWGAGAAGQLTVPLPNVDFAGMAGGEAHSLGLKVDGTIRAWGSNTDGQCNIPAPNEDFIAVASGALHSLGLKADGAVVGWGHNGYGQCDVSLPNDEFIAVAGGGFHSLGLKADGSIAAWGNNGDGQCDVPAPNQGFIAVAGGLFHSLGLKRDGTVVTWGNNDFGQGVDPVPNEGFIAIAAGQWHNLGLKRDGSIVAWGNNGDGQCTVPSPNAGFVRVAGGGYHSLGVKADGSVTAWGSSGAGQCSVPSPNERFVRVAAGVEHSLGLKGIFGDLNRDGQVTADDFTVFATCLGGPGVVVPPVGSDPIDFSLADLNGDIAVDLADFAGLQEAAGTVW